LPRQWLAARRGLAPRRTAIDVPTPRFVRPLARSVVAGELYRVYWGRGAVLVRTGTGTKQTTANGQRSRRPSQRLASRAKLQRYRPFILAAIALLCLGLVVAGTFGVVRYVSTYWLYRGFAEPILPRSIIVRRHGVARRVRVIPVSVQQITIASRALGGYADPVDVVLPPGYATHPARRYPVLYLLEGSPGDPSNFLTVGALGVTDAELVAAHRIQPLILVMPAGGRSFFSDEEWVNGVQPGNDWETFVASDLVNTIDARYRTVASGAWRGLAGLSEGGYGALNIGLHHPGEFRLLQSWSGYMRAFPLTSVYDHDQRLLRYNTPVYTVRVVAPRLRRDGTYIWFYSGTRDVLKPQNLAFNTELTGLGIPHHFFPWPGTHDWGMWRYLAPRALRVASEHLGHG
jgi:enterochelin esterase-like enzyme